MLVGNPHLRAKFAQLLALMIPPDEEEQGHGRNAIKDSWVGVAVYNESMLSFFLPSLIFFIYFLTLTQFVFSFSNLSVRCLSRTLLHASIW